MGKYLDATGLSHFISKIKTTFQEKLVSGTNIKTINNTSLLGNGNIGIPYAESSSAGGNANYTNAILYGTVDSTSTSTAYTATVAGLEQLVDGTCVMLHNGVVTSAAGFTVNINDLGAKKCYNNMTNATQDTTIFNVNYTMLFVYASALDGGNGGWWIYRGYDGNTNTIGYQVRTNSGNKVAADKGYRYRLWFTSADGSKWVPANTSTATDATTARSLNTRAIDPFGPIVYRATNGTCNSGAGIGATGIWQQYTLSIGYSYMASGFSLSFPDSVYLKCTPNADGSATMNSIVQALPSSKDGKIYIHLGTAYSATNMELQTEHPVYWHDGTGIRVWTGAEPSGGGGSTVTVTQSLTSGTQVGSISVDGNATALYAPTPPTASTTNPSMDGTASYGSGTDYARANHVHPTDTSRAASDHTHGNITNGGDITATAPTVASGDKLIINDESASKITNGPSFGTSTTTYLRNDGTWDTPAGTANQNAFSNVKVGNTTVAAEITTDTLELVGSNVTLTPDATNDKVTIGITASNVTTALGNTAVARASANANGTTFGGAAVKSVDTSISSGSTSTNLPTTAAVVNYIAGMTTSVSMEDTDVDDAVNAAWSGVGISVANGVSF